MAELKGRSADGAPADGVPAGDGDVDDDGHALHRVGLALNADLDIGHIVANLIDAATDLTGAAFGAFFSCEDASGASDGPFLLHTASGLEPGAFTSIPPLRRTAILGTGPGGEIQRVDDLLADPGRTPPPVTVPAGHPPVRSYLTVPVVSRTGAAVGALFLGSPHPGVFAARHERLAVGVAGAVAVTVEHAGLLEAEQRARRETQRSASRLAILQDISGRLSRARSTPEVVAVICASVRAGIAATTAYVMRHDEAAGLLHMLGSTDPHEEVRRRFAMVSVDLPLPGGDVVRSREPLVLRSIAERDERYPALRGVDTHGDAAFVVVPLLLDDRVVGVLSLGWNEPRDVPEADLVQLSAIGRQCANALDRVWLYEATEAARRTAESTAERLWLQQELTARLSRALDTDEVAAVILEYAVGALGAETASVTRVDERAGALRLMATHGLEAESRGFTTIPLDAPYPACEAARSGRMVVVRDRAERDAAYPAMSAATSEAFACVPLTLEERIVGVLVVTFGPRLDLTDADRRFLDAIAHQCAQAFERARLYDASRSVASMLQRSLLPAHAPAIAGLDVAVRYRPVGRAALVGGDFYDVFRIAPGRWGVVIGDVSGKGIPAASLTALARYTVRAAARREPSPAEVLGFLNEAVLDGGTDERFCTVVYLEVAPRPDATLVRFSVGGHPLPVLRRPGGEVSALGRPGMAIGLLPMPDVEDYELLLAPGEALVLYTDGVAEARSPEGTFATGIVDEVLARAADDDDAETLADSIERATLDFQGGKPRDDVAVLVLRVPRTGESARWPLTESTAVTLDCQALSVGAARRTVRSFLRGHGVDGVEDVASLLVSELVTNAVLHARTAVGLRIAAVGDRLRVEVSDGSRARPVRQEFRPEATGGRGLLLLDRLAASWDVRRTPDGKTVWFELDLGASPAAGDDTSDSGDTSRSGSTAPA